MAMSRRFFNNIATQLRELKPAPKDYDLSCEYDAALSIWGRSVLATTRAITEESPSFDRDRFLMAAGMEHLAEAAGA